MHPQMGVIALSRVYRAVLNRSMVATDYEAAAAEIIAAIDLSGIERRMRELAETESGWRVRQCYAACADMLREHISGLARDRNEAAARHVLIMYGEHRPACDAKVFAERPCTCGFRDGLRMAAIGDRT